MKPVLIEWTFRRRAQPHVIIYTGRRRRIGFYIQGLFPIEITPDFYRSYISQLTAMNKINGIPQMLLASLPLSGLHHLLVSLLGRDHHIAFPDRITHRLFAIHIFASFTGVYHYQCMPVVRRADYDRVN